MEYDVIFLVATLLQVHILEGDIMLLIYENGIWNEYNHLSPYYVNEKKDETLDNAIVYRVSKSNKQFAPRTRVMIVDDITTHWIVEHMESEEHGALWYQTLYLIEPTELLKGYPLDNLSVTQPLKPDDYHPRKTIRSVIDRLIKIAIPHMHPIFGSTDHSRDLSTIIQIVDDPRLEEIAPEDVFVEMTLFDALVKIGLYIDSVPKLKFGGNNNEKLILYFEPLDIKEKLLYRINKPLNRVNNWSITSCTDQIISNSFNTISNVPVVYPSSNTGTRIVSEITRSIFDLDFSNGYIQLPSKVMKITKMEIAIDFLFINTEWKDWSQYLYEYGEWQTLYPLTFSEDSSSNIPAHKRQPYTMYYKMNDDRIYFGKDFLNLSEDLRPLNPIIGWIFDFLGIDIGKPGNLIKYLFRYRFEIVPEVDLKVKSGNDDVNNFAIISNQESTNINIVALKNKLDFLLKRIKSGDFELSYNYKNYNDIPKVGHLLNDKVITNLSYIRYRDHYHVTFQLNDDYTRRSEFIREKQEIRTWEIPPDKGNKRFITYTDTLYISLSPFTSDKLGKTAIDQPDHLFPIFRFYDEDDPRYNILRDRYEAGLLAQLSFIGVAGPGNIYSVITYPLFVYTDNSLLINVSAQDNTIWGKRLIKHGARYYPQGVTYTDPFGEVDRINFILTNQWYDLMDEEQFEQLPLVNPVTSYELTERNKAVYLRHLVVLKDAAEIFNFTYQLDVKVERSYEEQGFILRKEFFEYCGAKNGWLIDFYPHIYFFNQKIGKTEEITSDMIVRIIRIDRAYFPIGEHYKVTYEFDGDLVPTSSSYESFGIGVRHKEGRDAIFMVFNQASGWYWSNLRSGSFNIYIAY